MTNTTANPRQKLLLTAVTLAVVLAVMMAALVSVGAR
jgi:hypothetical protein